MSNYKIENVEVKQVVKASKVNGRYGLYKIIDNGVEIGFIEKAFHCPSFRIGTPGQPSYQTFSTLQQAISHLQIVQKTILGIVIVDYN